MEPVENRESLDASVEEDAPQPGAAVGERGQYRLLGASDSIEVAADQGREIRVGLRHGAEHPPASRRRLDVADPDLQVPLARLATPDEGRIPGRPDRLGWSRRPDRHWHRQFLDDLEGRVSTPHRLP